MPSRDDILREQVNLGARLWTIIYPPPYVAGSPVGALARFPTDDYGEVVALFDDPYLAMKLRDAVPDQRLGVSNFTHPGHVRLTLELMKRAGITHVAVNYSLPADGRRADGEFLEIDRAIFIYGSEGEA